mmetsp:Transcript_77286/g.153350  ORF Transcript_77286/g.153350 Transcript_77286/m.153350 type:complete len:244 (+) Transcript_77286:558-1289(+)
MSSVWCVMLSSSEMAQESQYSACGSASTVGLIGIPKPPSSSPQAMYFVAMALKPFCNRLTMAMLTCSRRSPTMLNMQRRSSGEETPAFSSFTPANASRILCKLTPLRNARPKASSSLGGIKISTPPSSSSWLAMCSSYRHQHRPTKRGANQGPTNARTLPTPRIRAIALSAKAWGLTTACCLQGLCKFSHKQHNQMFVLRESRCRRSCHAANEPTISWTELPQAYERKWVAKPTFSSPFKVST